MTNEEFERACAAFDAWWTTERSDLLGPMSMRAAARHVWLNACKKRDAEVAALRKALKFYSRKEDYDGRTCHDGDGHYDVMGYEILEDEGRTARVALGEEKEEKRP